MPPTVTNAVVSQREPKLFFCVNKKEKNDNKLERRSSRGRTKCKHIERWKEMRSFYYTLLCLCARNMMGHFDVLCCKNLQ